MPTVCVFELNKTNATYFGGENIAGTVVLKTTSVKNVRDISIRFVGEGKVKWEESNTTTDSDGHTSTNTTYYRSHEIYINNSTRVHGDGILPPGTHTYTFDISLPLDCPTSFEGKYGHIRYELSLKIKRSFKFDNLFKKPVTLIRTIDLNLNPIYKLPLEGEAISSSCSCSCLTEDTIFYVLRIPFGAYAPGQIVKYALQIANKSMDDTEGYKIQFIQKIIFTAKSPHKDTRTLKNVLLERRFHEKCLRLTNRVIEGGFPIPATPPSTGRSSIICAEYTFKVTVLLSGCSSNVELKLPIIVGTVPMRESLIMVVAEPRQEQEPSAPEMPTEKPENIKGDMPPNYNETKPPTFEEATRSNSPFIDTDIDERNRIVGFRPLYPMYNTSYSEKI